MFERLCRVIMLTEMRGMWQVEKLLKSPLIKHDPVMMRIFKIVEKDEPSHWMPYRDWLARTGRRQAKWTERLTDFWIHRELLFLKIPFLFLNPWLPRRTDWADALRERTGAKAARRRLSDARIADRIDGVARALSGADAARGGHEVTGIDVAPGPDTQVVGSVADRALVERTMLSHGIEGVIHAGALHKPDIVRYPRQAFVDVNVTGTLNLLEEAVAAGVERFVFTSTTSLMITQAIRDETRDRRGVVGRASGPLQPRNVYGVTKRPAEELCRLVHGETGLPVVVLRTARFFPEDDDTHRELSART